MKKGKRLFALLLAFILCFHMGSMDVKAEGASVTIALSSGTVSIGGSVTVTVTVSGSDVSQYDIYLTYDSSVLQYNSSSGAAQANGSGGTIRLVGGTGSTSLTFTAIANGSSYVSTSGSEVYNISYEQIPITHAGANITVETVQPATTEGSSTGNNTTEDGKTEEPATEEDKRSADCNLSSLQVSPGKLEPAFSASTTSYFVQLEEDVSSIVVSAQTADEKASTAVSGADSLKKGENTVKVTVTAENGAVKIYNIRVAVGEIAEGPTVTIDGVPYRFLSDATELQVPERYSAISVQYEGTEVMAYESPNKKLVIVCLENEEFERSWFVYNQQSESFIPYQEHSSKFNRYVVLPVPDGVEVPQGYSESELNVQGKKIPAYQSAASADIWLIYAMNIDGGEGFYFYDAGEDAFMRYMDIHEEQIEDSTEDSATPEEPKKTETEGDAGTNQILLYALCCVSGLAVLFLVLMIVFAVKRQALAAELEQAESIIDHMANGQDKEDKREEPEPEPEKKNEEPPVWDGYIDIIKVPGTGSDSSEPKV